MTRPTSDKRRRLVKSLLKRDGDRCYWCGLPFTDVWVPTLEHLTPRSQEGSNRKENLVLADQWCNDKRGDMSQSDFAVWISENWTPHENRKIRPMDGYPATYVRDEDLPLAG